MKNVIPSQSADWRGNPHPKKEIVPKGIPFGPTPACALVRNDNK